MWSSQAKLACGNCGRDASNSLRIQVKGDQEAKSCTHRLNWRYSHSTVCSNWLSFKWRKLHNVTASCFDSSILIEQLANVAVTHGRSNSNDLYMYLFDRLVKQRLCECWLRVTLLEVRAYQLLASSESINWCPEHLASNELSGRKFEEVLFCFICCLHIPLRVIVSTTSWVAR